MIDRGRGALVIFATATLEPRTPAQIELALRAPDISNELRRLADEVEFDAVQLGHKGQSRDDAA